MTWELDRRTWGKYSSVLPLSVTTVGHDRTAAVFFTCTDGLLACVLQFVDAESRWSDPVSLATGLSSAPVAAHTTDGRAVVFFRRTDNTLRFLQSQPATVNGWLGWAPKEEKQIPGVTASGDPAVAYNADGRIELFYPGPDGALWHVGESGSSGGGTWSAPVKLGGTAVRDLVATTRLDGRIALFYVNTSGDLHLIQQNGAGAWPGGFMRLLTGIDGPPAAAPFSADHATIVVSSAQRSGSGNVLSYRTDQNSTTSWGAPDILRYAVTATPNIDAGGRPCLATRPDGRLVAAITFRGTVWVLQQPEDFKNPWTTLAQVATDATSSPVITADGRGNLTVHYTDGEHRVNNVLLTDLDIPARAQLICKMSGLAADIGGGSTDNDAPALQWNPGDGDNQKFTLAPTGDGHYRIIAKHSGKVLAISWASTDDGAALIQYDSGDQDNEKYQLVPAADGHYRIIARHSGKVVCVQGASTDPGAPLIQWDSGSQDNEIWTLRPIPDSDW